MRSLKEVTQLFDTQRISSRLHHAWIVEGISEAAMDDWLVKAVGHLLNNAIDASHFHPNLFWLTSSDPHNIDAAREAINFLEKTSWDGGWKVCVITAADQLNIQAQNALLKIMEEPPERSIIFLASERANALLPTLYSRGIHVIIAEENKQSEVPKFIAEWTQAVSAILERSDFAPLFAFQSYLTENEFDAETQGKWVMLALKNIIDAEVDTSLPSQYNWRQCWTNAHEYLSKALEFNIDHKQISIKLTTKILGELL